MVTCKNIQLFSCKFECNQKLNQNVEISKKYCNIFIACIYNPEFESLQKRSFFSPLKCPICPFGPSSPLLSGYYVAVIPAVKQLWCEANHSPLSSTQIKNDWSNSSTPPIYHHVVHRDNFTLYMLYI